MATKLASAIIEFGETGFGRVRTALNGAFTGLRKVASVGLGPLNSGLAAVRTGFAGIGSAIGLATRYLGPFLAAFGAAKLVSLANDNEEVGRRFKAVYRDLAEEVQSRVDAIASAVGRNASDIQSSFITFQNLFEGFEIGSREAADLAETMSRLSLDFASFFNIADADAINAFVGGIVSSGRELKKYGINLDDVAVEQELLAQGFKGTARDATEAQVALAKVAIVTKRLGETGVIGDAITSSGTLSNQFKSMKDDIIGLAETIGAKLIQPLTIVVRVVREFVAAINLAINAIGVASGATGEFGNIAESLSASLQDVKRFLTELALAFVTIWDQIQITVLSAIGNIADALGEFAGLFSDDLAASLAQFGAGAREAIKEIEEEITKKINAVINSSVITDAQKQQLGALPKAPPLPAGGGKASEGGGGSALTAPAEVFRSIQAQAAKEATMDQVLKAQLENDRRAAQRQEEAEKKAARQRDNLASIMRDILNGTLRPRPGVFAP